jgi:hypothetical protein
MTHTTRRELLGLSAAAAAAARWGPPVPLDQEAEPGVRPPRAEGVMVLNPRARVPLSFIIDDSTCLVNAAHFKIPQFAEVYPDNYKKPWRSLPREIPDSFVRKFGDWCRERGIKGKYSVIPYPACVGWIDRFMPGWTQRELDESLKLLREELAPDWDFHPEMISHTWGVDTKTGRPYPDRTEKNLENTGFSVGKSTDFLADYMAYALRVLKSVGLPCEGVTTPGGFGNRVRPQLAQATLQACRDVYGAEIPHYFRHLFTDARSVAPRVEYASGLDGPDPRCVVSIIGCTGDWFGGWDGLEIGSADRFITEDLQKGRLVEVIERGEPAILVCHWPGIYFNGQEVGFKIFQEVVKRLHAKYDNLIWMKNSEIARYWAAKELTRIETGEKRISLQAPFATSNFTVQWKAPGAVPRLVVKDQPVALKEAAKPLDLAAGTWTRTGDSIMLCFDLPKGSSRIEWA